MRPGHITAVLVAVGALMAGTLTASPAQAALPDDLTYSYELDTPILGPPSAFASSGNCTQSLGPAFSLLMNGQPEPGLTPALATAHNDVRCTLESTANSSGMTMRGRVSAASGGQSGSGDFTLLCDISRSMSSWFNVVVSGSSIPELAANPYGVNGSGHVSCSWTIDVADSQKSQVSGTLEMAGSFSLDSTPVAWSFCAALGLPIPDRVLPRAKCVSFDMVISAYVTGGTGAFAGRSGDGSMTQTLYIPVVIPIDLSVPPPPPDPGCPPEQPDCKPFDLSACEYSATDPGDPTWNDLRDIPPAAGAGIPGYRGPGWYRCPGDDGSGGGGGGGAGDGLSRCQYSPTEQTDPGWSYIALPPGADVPGYQGPGWYHCGDTPPPPPAPTVISDEVIRGAFGAALSPRSLGNLLSLSTEAGKSASPRIVAPARVAGSNVRPFATTSSTTVRLSTVPGATCDVIAKSGKVTAKIATKARATNGQLNTGVTAPTLMSRLKAPKGSQATITATCSTKVGKKTTKLPAATITVAFS